MMILSLVGRTMATVHVVTVGRSLSICSILHQHAEAAVKTGPTTPEAVRVRFAPSPTGSMHLGGLQTALYNFLFARRHGGKFILRIEDTDRTRFVAGAEEQCCSSLEHYGLVPDESPSKGGDFGPYRQSERLHIYQQHAEKLLQTGHAYRCFCDAERLEHMKVQAARLQKPPHYDNRCRELSSADVESKLKGGQPYVLRFKPSADLTEFQDDIYGTVEHDLSSEEGDFIIVKSDGYPTYHFANVVDDHCMHISHVLRGAEWLVSTIKHVQLYCAFGWSPPRYMHLPLLKSAGEGDKKLSKREHSAYLEYYWQMGYLPLAVLNVLMRNGSGLRNFSLEQYRLYKLHEMIDNFDETLISKRSLKVDPELLNVYGREAFQQATDEQLIPVVREFLINNFANLQPDDYRLSNAHLGSVIGKLKRTEENLSHLHQLAENRIRFMWTDGVDSFDKLFNQYAPNLIEKALHVFTEYLRQSNYCISGRSEEYYALADRVGVPKPKLLRLFRFVLTGSFSGPPLVEVVEHLGAERVTRRIEECLSQVRRKTAGATDFESCAKAG